MSLQVSIRVGFDHVVQACGTLGIDLLNGIKDLVADSNYGIVRRAEHLEDQAQIAGLQLRPGVEVVLQGW